MKTGLIIIWRAGAAIGAGMMLLGILGAAHVHLDYALPAALGAAMLVFFWHPLPVGPRRDEEHKE